MRKEIRKVKSTSCDLDIQDCRVSQVKNLVLGLTQENSIENSVQDCLLLYTKTPWSMLTISSLP